MRLAVAGAVGAVKAAAAGATAPSTPTITAMADGALTQWADFAFTWSSNNGAALSSIQIRWSTSAGMTSPTSLTAYTGSIRTGSTFGGGSPVALAAASPGAHWYNTGSMSGTKPADDTAAYYQLRLTNSAGSSGWSNTFGPITTTTEPG